MSSTRRPSGSACATSPISRAGLARARARPETGRQARRARDHAPARHPPPVLPPLVRRRRPARWARPARRRGLHVPPRERAPLPRRPTTSPRCFEAAGFEDVRYRLLGGGIVALHVGSESHDRARGRSSGGRARRVPGGGRGRARARGRASPGSRRRGRPRRARRGRQAAAAGARLSLLRRPDDDPPVAAGAAVELVHMATLVHDDLIDGAAVRRGRAAAWSEHGEQAAKAAGDYLFARAFSVLAETGDAERGGGPGRRLARARPRRGDAAPSAARSRHDRRRLPRALRPEDRRALRGGVRARRRQRRVRAAPRRRVPDRRRRARLHGRHDRDRQGAGHGSPGRHPDAAAPPRRAGGSRRPRRARRRAEGRRRSSASPRAVRSTGPASWPCTTLRKPGLASTAPRGGTSSRR